MAGPGCWLSSPRFNGLDLRAPEELVARIERRAVVSLQGSNPSSNAYEAVSSAIRSRSRSALEEGYRELSLPAVLLVGEQPGLFAEVDRLRAEGELRTAVGRCRLRHSGSSSDPS